jgi:hypothetical protein
MLQNGSKLPSVGARGKKKIPGDIIMAIKLLCRHELWRKTHYLNAKTK